MKRVARSKNKGEDSLDSTYFPGPSVKMRLIHGVYIQVNAYTLKTQKRMN